MKTVLALALAAGALIFSSGAEAGERHPTHRHATSVSKHVAHGRHAHRAHRPAVSSRCDCRRSRVADHRGDAPLRGPFAVESMDDGRAAPTANNDYWFQESIYDVQAGKRGNVKEYRY